MNDTEDKLYEFRTIQREREGQDLREKARRMKAGMAGEEERCRDIPYHTVSYAEGSLR